MPLNKQKGDMYGFITHTLNVIKGRCSHDCTYCYMKKWGDLGPIRFDKSELKTNLGSGNFIFVGSSTDMFAADVMECWIDRTLNLCSEFPGNKYLFQTKNPKRFLQFTAFRSESLTLFPPETILGTTIESNRRYGVSRAPGVYRRADAMRLLAGQGYETMITIEPLLDFDLDKMVELIKYARPAWVNIGADSGGHDLPEPDPEKIKQLIEALKDIPTIKLKNNLERITGGTNK
ncbi:MAG: DUF5131 family protein [Gammaproteobacteria bacterium]|nr:DUF5131 family protein [Gammaproteobacteria bacterium]